MPGIKIHNLGWLDFDIPSSSQLIGIVKLMTEVINKGEKVLIHCHAGYGRTGLAIAAYLIFNFSVTDKEAIEVVRSRRKKSIQRQKQSDFLKSFYDYVTKIRIIFPNEPISLQRILENQNVLSCGEEHRENNVTPKILVEVYTRLAELINSKLYTSEQILHAFCDPNNDIFNYKYYENPTKNDCTLEQKIFLRKLEINGWVWNLHKENDPRVLAQLALY